MKSQAVTTRGSALRFGEFTLDPANRLLLRGGLPVDLGGRYFDALVMLVRERGKLVSKDRLHEEVWRGVPVTDEALSQAIMALRRALGDDAARPRFIETVPRHGYRFVGQVEWEEWEEHAEAASGMASDRRGLLAMVAGGGAGAAATGIVVGMVYGSLAAGAGEGNALSLVLVLGAVSVLAALVSGLGIAGGVALAVEPGYDAWWRPVLGGALGGLLVGGFAGLLGADTLRLLTGSAPDRITGSGEGLMVGLATGASYWLGTRRKHPSRYAIGAGLGALAGGGIVVGGGTLMAGSLAAMVKGFPGAGLSMAWIESPGWFPASGVFECALFTGLVAAGMLRATGR